MPRHFVAQFLTRKSLNRAQNGSWLDANAFSLQHSKAAAFTLFLFQPKTLYERGNLSNSLRMSDDQDTNELCVTWHQGNCQRLCETAAFVSLLQRRAELYQQSVNPFLDYFAKTERLVTVDVTSGVADLIWNQVHLTMCQLDFHPNRTVNTVVLFVFSECNSKLHALSESTRHTRVHNSGFSFSSHTAENEITYCVQITASLWSQTDPQALLFQLTMELGASRITHCMKPTSHAPGTSPACMPCFWAVLLSRGRGANMNHVSVVINSCGHCRTLAQ